MQTLSASSSPSVVFTATTPGVFTLVLVGSGYLYCNTNLVISSTSGQKSAAVIMDTGDTLSYAGGGAQLAGFRSGNEFEDS